MMSTCDQCNGFATFESDPSKACWKCGGLGLLTDGVAQRPAVQGCTCSACLAHRYRPTGATVTVPPDNRLRDITLGLLGAAVVLVLLILALA